MEKIPSDIERTLDRDDVTAELRAYIDDLHKRLTNLDSAVADFLDADSAWNNDECEEGLVVAAQNQMKHMLYDSRRVPANDKEE